MPRPFISLGLFAAGALLGFLLWQAAAPHYFPSREELLVEKEISTATSDAAAIPTAVASSSAVRVPIVVYHIVRPSYPDDSAAVKAIAVTPEVFDEEMAYLADNGYTVIPFSRFEDYFYNSTPLPPKAVVLNFDDGWESQYVYAFPILTKYHYTATFFIPSNFPGHSKFITWDQLKTMLAAGMTVGSHSESHPYLTKITSTSTLWDEIEGSKQVLEKKLGIQITEFNYPFGMFNAAAVEMAKKAGYRVARADYFGLKNSASTLFTLGALNAPTDLQTFKKYFPPASSSTTRY